MFSLVIVGLSIFRKSKLIEKKLPKWFIISASATMTLIAAHIGAYIFDQPFLIFLGSISILSFYITFEDYYEKKIVAVLITLFMGLEMFIWQYFFEPIISVYTINILDLQLLHSFIPIITVVVAFLLNLKIKLFSLKATTTIFVYFLVSMVVYLSYVSNKDWIKWFVSIIVSTIYFSLIAFVSSSFNRYFSSIYKGRLNIDNPNLNVIQKYNKGQDSLKAFVSYNNIQIAPLLVLYFSSMYDLKKYGSYRKHKKNIYKYLQLIEKSIQLILPKTKIMFFESGYYEISLVFTVDGLEVEDLLKIKNELDLNNIEGPLGKIALIIKNLNNISFRMINKEGKNFEIIPRVGLSFFGFHGELFEDLLTQAMVNTQSIAVNKLKMFTIEDKLRKSYYQSYALDIAHILNSPLIDINLKKVIYRGEDIGRIISFSFQGETSKLNINTLNKQGKAAFYSQKMFYALTRKVTQNEKKIFITLPSFYFQSKIFNKESFKKVIEDFQNELKTELEIVLRDSIDNEVSDILKELKILGINISVQDFSDNSFNIFNYKFKKDCEFTNSNYVEVEKFTKNNFLNNYIDK